MPILGIGGIPLWNGYISKTLIHESMVEYIEVLKEAGQSIAFMKGAEILFLFSGGLTLAYMTKIFVCIFLEDNPYGAPKPVKNGPYISKLMAVHSGRDCNLPADSGYLPSPDTGCSGGNGRTFA